MSRSWRPAALVALVALLLQAPAASYDAPELDGELVETLGGRGLVADSPQWLPATTARWPDLRRRARAVFRAHNASPEAGGSDQQPHDIYLATVSLTPEGRLLRLDDVFNLTRTNVADEDRLLVEGYRVAWTIAGQARTYTLKLLDFQGETPNRQWSRIDRIKQAITNLQHTGQSRGVAQRAFKFDPAAEKVSLSFQDGALQVQADSNRIVIADEVITGQRYVREQTQPRARPGNFITWAVDRVRESQSFGDERMQWLKAISYRALDLVRRLVGAAMPEPEAADLSDELGETLSAPLTRFTDPETGWPPQPLEPVLDPALEGEGQWRALDNDPYVRNNPGLPPSFLTTFIRTDEERKFSRLFVVLWDPRQVELHMMSGTEEPVSATGETGQGLVPRDPKLIERLLAGFNGGFQGSHGGFGMAVGPTLYVPPKPYAATVARLRDGSTAFGTWPATTGDRPTLEVTERGQIPGEIDSFRQNLTPLIADSKLNPYGRIWWGGVPQEWEDDTRTVRSGLCKNREGFLLYFYGATVDHVHLAKAMEAAHCDYALHLDMNQGHTGLEFYQVDREEQLPLLEGKLHSMWQAQGPVPQMSGYRFRGRRLFKTMQLMNFPRFIRQERRDFFYLTLRYLLPGPRVALTSGRPESGEGQWKTAGLPQYGFPYALATSEVRPDPARPETKVRLLKLDPKFLGLDPKPLGAPPDTSPSASEDVLRSEAPASNASASEAARSGAIVLSIDNPGFVGPDSAQAGQSDAPGERVAIVLEDGFRFAKLAPSNQQRRVLHGYSRPGVGTVSAAGIGDKDGMLYFAQVATAAEPNSDGVLLERLLQSVGCSAMIFQSQPPRLAIAGNRDLSGHPVRSSPTAVRLYRAPGPGARTIFERTPIVPREEWYWPQKGKERPW